MPCSILFVDPSVTSANGIVVDGVAYGLIGSTAVPPGPTPTIDSECPDGCPGCPPVPCTCPDGLASSYQWNSGGSTVTLELVSPCTWHWQDALDFNNVTLTLAVTSICQWEVQVVQLYTGTCQTYKMTGATPVGSYPDFDCDAVTGYNNSIS